MLAIPTLAPPSASAPWQLLVDSLLSPALGIDSPAPVFRWALPPGAAAGGVASVSIRDAVTGAEVWLGSAAAGAQSLAYGGAPLLAARRYTWSVTAGGGVSAAAEFVTGLHGAPASGAAPAWAANGSASFVFLRLQAPLIGAPAALIDAVAFVTAAPQAYFGPIEADNAKLTGAYKLWVNGALQGMGPGKPSRCGPLCPVQHAAGSCDCAPEHLYDVRDVLAAARASDDASITLALAGFNYPPSAAPLLPTASRMFLQLVLTFRDNSTQVLSTGAGDWRAYDATAYMGPRGSFGDSQWYLSPLEQFDARAEPAGWKLPSFDAASWPAAANVAPFAAPLVARPALALSVVDDAALLAPPLSTAHYPSHTFVDFGTDFSGGVCLDATAGVAGVVLAMRIGEEAAVDASGARVVLPMRTSNVDAQNWTLRDGAQTICMHEWAQFRFASLTAAAGQPAPASYAITLRPWVVTYPTAYAPLAAFEAASPDGNATARALLDVYGLSWWTRVAQSFDMYFDHVRQRDVYCVEELTIDLLQQYALSSEWALQPLTLAYVLNNRPEGYGWAEWPALALLSVHSIYLHTGELTLFLANYARLRNFTLAGLVAPGSGLWTCAPGSTLLDCAHPEVDWPPSARDGFVFTPTNAVVNAIAHAAMRAFAELATAAGHAADGADFAARADALRVAADAALRTPTGAYRDGVTTNHTAWHSTVFALAMGLPPPAAAPAVAAALLARTPARGGTAAACFPSSVWPTQWALEGLYTADADDHGRAALELLTCEHVNGWMGMLAQNATQAPEAWSPQVKGNLEWGMTWGAAPGDLVPRFVLGVRPAAPGFAAVLLQPQPGALTLVAGVVPTIRGTIAVRFTQALGADGLATAARLEATLPGATPATACLPLSACPAARMLVDGVAVDGQLSGDYACIDTPAVAASPRVFQCPA